MSTSTAGAARTQMGTGLSGTGGKSHPFWREYLHYGPTLCCTAAVPMCFAPRTSGVTADSAPCEELGVAAEVDTI